MHVVLDQGDPLIRYVVWACVRHDNALGCCLYLGVVVFMNLCSYVLHFNHEDHMFSCVVLIGWFYV